MFHLYNEFKAFWKRSFELIKAGFFPLWLKGEFIIFFNQPQNKCWKVFSV